MVRYWYYLCSACLAAFVAASQAQAVTCTDRATVVARLAEVYGEQERSLFTSPDGTTAEVFAAMDTGSWTITITGPDGMTCLVASGAAFDWRHLWYHTSDA
jgi:hypothetical protein